MKILIKTIRKPGLTAGAVLVAALMLLSLTASAQESFPDFYTQNIKINNTGMYILGSWAVLNLATGAYGWSEYSGDRMYFHQMNLFWNVVNVSIAGFALYGNYTTDTGSFSQQELMEKMLKTENILLINAGLDIGYIGTGFLLRHLSGKSDKRADLLKGYGSSLILQGGFLLVFDLILYGVLRADRMDFLNKVDIAMLPDGFMIGLSIPVY
ncbi:MAG: hypothetical protein V2I34_11655 [Bacteroidales bacterium]|jgi:hypothetical protein|nr:hypothetical protein [Bacteroidales bacterium]